MSGRDLSKATPQDYLEIFEINPHGALILEELVERFGGSIYVRGGHEAERQTTFNAGRRAVLDFILGRISLASGAPEPTDGE